MRNLFTMSLFFLVLDSFATTLVRIPNPTTPTRGMGSGQEPQPQQQGPQAPCYGDARTEQKHSVTAVIGGSYQYCVCSRAYQLDRYGDKPDGPGVGPIPITDTYRKVLRDDDIFELDGNSDQEIKQNCEARRNAPGRENYNMCQVTKLFAPAPEINPQEGGWEAYREADAFPLQSDGEAMKEFMEIKRLELQEHHGKTVCKSRICGTLSAPCCNPKIGDDQVRVKNQFYRRKGDPKTYLARHYTIATKANCLCEPTPFPYILLGP